MASLHGLNIRPALLDAPFDPAGSASLTRKMYLSQVGKPGRFFTTPPWTRLIRMTSLRGKDNVLPSSMLRPIRPEYKVDPVDE